MSQGGKNWDLHVEHAEEVARSAGFGALRDRIVSFADVAGGEVVVDVGSGTGLLTLALAQRARVVWAIDSSKAMGEYLAVKAESGGLINVRTVLASATSLPLVDGIADVVVSNYCYHEMREDEKMRALSEALRVLKPGGRLVIGDMMFSLNPVGARDRKLVLDKVISIGRRGLPGIWRLLKNSARLLLGRWEHPANADWWRQALPKAGFEAAHVETFAHEGGIAFATRPIATAERPAVATDMRAESLSQAPSPPRASDAESPSLASGSG